MIFTLTFLMQQVFKSSAGHKIWRVVLGGQVGGPRERVFVASGINVMAFTKKGKNFLTFDTNMSEPIQSL